jgi:EAL domain-containing protein (putative c-di-GMP-specific phosphodiesterase class I)
LDASGLAAELLTLEIVESLVMENFAAAVSVLDGIKQAGVKIAMDDFGTGYSSLSYLTQLPLNSVKIDRSFTRALDAHRQSGGLMEAMLGITRVMNLNVVAEGVETEEQLRMLVAMQCDYVQGYLFSKPVPPDEAGTLLRRQWNMSHLQPGDRVGRAGGVKNAS